MFSFSTDKFVIKVAKKTSHTLLALSSRFPVYVSLNTRDGETECRMFFPDDFVNGKEGPEEEEEDEDADDGEAGGLVGDEEGDGEKELAENGDGEELMEGGDAELSPKDSLTEKVAE